MGEMTNSLINEHCIGYTFQDKCRPYQENPAETLAENNMKTVELEQSEITGNKKVNRIKSKLIHNASNNQASGSTSLYSMSFSSKHITSLVLFVLFSTSEAFNNLFAYFAFLGRFNLLSFK